MNSMTLLRGSLIVAVGALLAGARPAGQSPAAGNEFYDSHFHLTNYIQKGIEVKQFLDIMGNPCRQVDALRHPASTAVVVRELG